MNSNHTLALLAAWLGVAFAADTRAQVTPFDASSTVQLSPFEVKEAATGYLATNTMSGTRLNTNLEDLASSISVVTKQQMADFAMLDINDIFAYEAGTEGAGTYTPFEIDRNGRVADTVMSDRESANRVRGVGAANISRSGFATSGRVPIDPIDIDAVEISRGPNSSIFGLGEGSGTVNMVAASANLNRATSTTQVRIDDTGGWRTSFDLSRPIVRGKLAARVSAVYQHDEFQQKPSGYNTRRLNAMIRAQPFKHTTLRASFQSYLADGTRATTMTPRDGVSFWRDLGRLTWDPITQTVTVNGASTILTGTNNPAGLANLNRAGPVVFVDNGGVQLWEISRLPAANATNGPSNTAGVNRLLESVPEPVRDGRPLFSIVRGVSDPSIYDYAHINLSGPNYAREEVATSTVEFEQFLFNTGRSTAAFQFAWQREDADRLRRITVGSINPLGTSGLIYVDPNIRLLDGRPNPFYLKPYVGVAEPVWSETPYQRDSYRAQLAYVLDLTREKSKWLRLLGRQQVLGYYEERKSKNHVYRFRDVMISDNPVYAPAGQPKGNAAAANGFAASQVATRPYFHYYVGDADGQNVDYSPSRAEAGTYDFTRFNPQTNQWVTPTIHSRIFEFVAVGLEEGPVLTLVATLVGSTTEGRDQPILEKRALQDDALGLDQVQGGIGVFARARFRESRLAKGGTGRFGISVTGHHNLIEACRAHDNQGTGINVGAPASHALVLNCDSYRNLDVPTRGQNADGFGAKFDVGPGIVFRGCRAWENADDGFDLWKAPYPVRIENCVAYRNGLDLWGIEGFNGNGNGFKVGGDFVAAAHLIVGCVATDQPKNGFDQNNNTGPLLFERCTAVRCGTGFSVILGTKSGEPSILRENVAWDAPVVLVHGTVEENNLWSGADRRKVASTQVESTALTRKGKEPYDPATSSGPPPRTPPEKALQK